MAVADKGFDSDQLRKDLMELGNRCCIPGRSNRLIPIVYNKAFYRLRHHVENFFQRIKSYRRIATRYEKLALTFLSFVQFAAILDWLRHALAKACLRINTYIVLPLVCWVNATFFLELSYPIRIKT